jgi:hypothetical protein
VHTRLRWFQALLACPLLKASLPARCTRAYTGPSAVNGQARALQLRGNLLALRGGASDEDDDDDDDDADSEMMRDKYEDEPPPDHIRYTGGVRPAPKAETRDQVESSNATVDLNATLAAEDAACASIKDEKYDASQAIHDAMRKDAEKESSDDEEPLWIPGQIRQGGKRLPYVDGHADYYRDVLNTTDPMSRFIPDYSQGHTYADMDFPMKAWQSYRPTEQDGMRTRTPRPDNPKRLITRLHLPGICSDCRHPNP